MARSKVMIIDRQVLPLRHPLQVAGYRRAWRCISFELHAMTVGCSERLCVPLRREKPVKRTTQIFASLLQDIDLSPTDQASSVFACVCSG